MTELARGVRRKMARVAAGPSNLTWTIKRLWLPTWMRPLAPAEAVSTFGRAGVGGVAAYGAGGGLVFGLMLSLLMLPLMPFVLVLRRLGVSPWTVEATTRPWGRRGPKRVMRWEMRGWQASKDAVEQIATAFEQGDGAPRFPNATRV